MWIWTRNFRRSRWSFLSVFKAFVVEGIFDMRFIAVEWIVFIVTEYPRAHISLLCLISAIMYVTHTLLQSAVTMMSTELGWNITHLTTVMGIFQFDYIWLQVTGVFDILFHERKFLSHDMDDTWIRSDPLVLVVLSKHPILPISTEILDLNPSIHPDRSRSDPVLNFRHSQFTWHGVNSPGLFPLPTNTCACFYAPLIPMRTSIIATQVSMNDQVTAIVTSAVLTSVTNVDANYGGSYLVLWLGWTVVPLLRRLVNGGVRRMGAADESR